MLPSPTDLHYFKETAAKLNLTKAAQSLRITQPLHETYANLRMLFISHFYDAG